MLISNTFQKCKEVVAKTQFILCPNKVGRELRTLKRKLGNFRGSSNFTVVTEIVEASSLLSLGKFTYKDI